MRAYAALAAGVLAISCASILVRLSSAPPLVISFYRLALAALVLLPFALPFATIVRRGGRRSPKVGRDRAWRSVAGRSWAGGSVAIPTLVAGILLGLHFACWITSLQLTTVASSVVLVTTTPVFAALLSSWQLGERAGAAAWAGIALSVLGAGLIGWGDYPGDGVSLGPAGGRALGSSALAGDLLALAGALFGAAYLTIGRKVRARVPLLGYLTAVYAAGALALAPWVALRGQRLLGYPPREYLLFAAIAIVPNLVGHSILNWAVRRMRTYVVNVASLGEPVLATVYAAVLFGEIPGTFWALGTGLIVLGVLTVFLAERSRTVSEPQVV